MKNKKEIQARYRAKNRELLAAKYWEYRMKGKEDMVRRNKLQRIKRRGRPPEKATELTKAMVTTTRNHIPRSRAVLEAQIKVLRDEVERLKGVAQNL